jgi:hypothetical protein
MQTLLIQILTYLAALPSEGGGGQTGGSGSSTGCPTSTNIIPCSTTGGNSIWGILTLIVNFLAAGVGLAVVAGIIYGAILYSSAGGSAEQAKKGITYIRNAVIAALLFVFMYAIINFIVPGGLF